MLPAISSASAWYLIHGEALTVPYGRTDCVSAWEPSGWTLLEGMGESGTGSHPVMPVLSVATPMRGAEYSDEWLWVKWSTAHFSKQSHSFFDLP